MLWVFITIRLDLEGLALRSRTLEEDSSVFASIFPRSSVFFGEVLVFFLSRWSKAIRTYHISILFP